MKWLLSLWMSLLLISSVGAQSKVYTDEVYELSAIVWRLAGAEEYNTSIYPSYGEDIKSYFSKYKKHPVMRFIREMRDAPDSVYVVSYNSVPVAAAVAVLEQGSIELNPDVDLEKYLGKNDPRWTVENLKRYMELLDDFYRRSQFNRFFRDHTALYEAYAADLKDAFPEMKTAAWFADMYGKDFPELTICVSPAFGVNNFSLPQSMMCAAGGSGIGAVVGVTYDPNRSDAKRHVHDLIHEISHSFTNPLFSPYRDRFKAAGKQIFPHLSHQLTAAGYGAPEVVVGEFLNELLTMMYLRDVLQEDLLKYIGICNSKGFIWAKDAVEYMDEFYANRPLYPTVDAFVPLLMEFMDTVADEIGTNVWDKYHQTPYVIATYPECGSTVLPDLSYVHVRFSHLMDTKMTAAKAPRTKNVRSIRKDRDDEAENMGIEDKTAYWQDGNTLIYRIEVPLMSGQMYGITVPGKYIHKANGMPMDEDYELYFKIR